MILPQDDSTKLLSALEKVSEQEIYFVLTYSARLPVSTL